MAEGTPGPGSKKGRPSRNIFNVMDTGELLAGILQDTESEAERERRQREQELASRADEELRRQSEMAEKRRLAAQEAIAREKERQAAAQQRRDLVKKTLAEVELTPEEAAAEEAEKLAQQQAAMLHAAQVYQAGQAAMLSGAYPVRRRLAPAIAIVASVVAVAAAVAMVLVLTQKPALDPTNYPKTALVFQLNPISDATTVNLHLIPAPEPEVPTTEELTTAEPTEAPQTAQRGRRGGRDRGRQSSDSTQDTEPSSTTLNIDLDRDNIFNRGSEGNDQ